MELELELESDSTSSSYYNITTIIHFWFGCNGSNRSKTQVCPVYAGYETKNKNYYSYFDCWIGPHRHF